MGIRQKRQIKNHPKFTSYTVLEAGFKTCACRGS